MGQSQYLRLISVAGALLVGFWLPIRIIGYVPTLSAEVFFSLVISIVSAINIYAYVIATVKPQSRIGLLCDIASLLPISLVGLIFLDKDPGLLLLINLLTVRHLNQIKPFLDQFASLQPIVYRLAPLLIALPTLVHLVACGWIALGSGSAGTNPDKYLEYCKAVYWTFTTLTTVGYGDITAVQPLQMLYACAIQVMGVGVFGFILSNVASLLSRSDAAREHHMDSLDRIETFMRIHRIPPEIKIKTRAYYHYLWSNKKGYKDSSLLEDLPEKIQSELWYFINKAIIEKVPFLKGAAPELIEELMSELKPRIYVPGEKIFRIDEPGDALYFMQNGEVEILDRNNSTIAHLGEGAFFGEMALISDKPRSATVKAKSFCDIYVLQRDSFDRVTSTYPDFRAHLEEIVSQRRTA